MGSRTDSPARASSNQGGKVKVDDRYFAGLGAANAGRSADLPPSQGGKYGGFGSQPLEQPNEARLPGLEDLQKDPVAALTKRFGWFTTTVGKTAKTVNDSYIQPTAKQVSSALIPQYPSKVYTRHRFENQILQPKHKSRPRMSHVVPKLEPRLRQMASTDL